MQVQIYSREGMEALLSRGKFPKNTAVISFHDPKDLAIGAWRPAPPIDYDELPAALFYVGVRDLDFDELGDCGLDAGAYLPEADAIAAFISDAHDRGMDIICQCEYGQSRSAACAAAILEHYEGRGIDIFSDYRYCPNRLIFNKLRAALGKEEKRRQK